MRLSGFALVITWSLLSTGRSAAASVVAIPASADNTLFVSPSGHLSNGVGDYLFAGTSFAEETRRALIKFDIAAAVPAGATITGASLQLHMSRTPAGSEPVALHRVLADWGEGASDAPGEEGAGGNAMPGDATWLHTFYSDQFWSQPGGDFDPVASASVDVIGIGYYTWASTPLLVVDLQHWLDNPGSNYGWMLLGNEGGYPTAKRFDSRENPDLNVRPVLTISYVPEPTTLSVLGLLLPGIFLKKRCRSRQ